MSSTISYTITHSPSNLKKQTVHTKTRQQTTKPTKCKWATLTYVWKEASFITNAFRRADLKRAFRTNNTTGNLFGHRNPAPEKFTLSGAYKLTCPDCNKAYVGQTGRRFSIRYNEHKIAFYNNSHTSSFAFTNMHIPSATSTSCSHYTITRKEPI